MVTGVQTCALPICKGIGTVYFSDGRKSELRSQGHAYVFVESNDYQAGDMIYAALPWQDVLALLERRQGLLDALVFSGGEATLQAALPEAMRRVRAMGFKVGLHTAGPYPERLRECLPLLDWVGMDLKAPFAEYERITGIAGSGAAVEESAALLRRSKAQ